jgi:hypothetical protein
MDDILAYFDYAVKLAYFMMMINQHFKFASVIDSKHILH